MGPVIEEWRGSNSDPSATVKRDYRLKPTWKDDFDLAWQVCSGGASGCVLQVRQKASAAKLKIEEPTTRRLVQGLFRHLTFLITLFKSK